MADGIRFELKGAQDVINAFNILPVKVARRLVVPTLRAMAKPLVKKARERVPEDTRALNKSLGVIVRKKRSQGVRLAVIGARADNRFWREDDDGNIRKPAKYSHLVEFGTVFQGKQPFLRPALDTAGQPAIDLGLKRMRVGIEKEAAKLNKKAASLGLTA